MRVPGQGVGAAGGGWRGGLQGGRVVAQSVEIPQVQFLGNVLTCPLPCMSGVRQNPHVFLNKVVDILVVQVVDVRIVQFLDKDVDMLVVFNFVELIVVFSTTDH